MLNLLKEEFNPKNKKVFAAMAALLALFVIILGVGIKITRVLGGVKYTTSLGNATSLLTIFVVIITCTRISGRDNLQKISENSINHSRLSIFAAKLCSIWLSYLILITINFVMVIIMKFMLFKKTDLDAAIFTKMFSAAGGNLVYEFLLVSFVLMVCSRIKDSLASIALGIAMIYITQVIAGIFMIVLYTNRALRWNPFNFFFVEREVVTPLTHMMTKLHVDQMIWGSLIYGLCFLIIAYILFETRKIASKNNAA
ncbi:hypothetical protein [Apilactobacillus xinyiensis]|uniref:ABC transporter permease n=1 Tax=Apilactobacillus xinyiensis TaxID=2841032 RepID=A0ABT0I2I8_9LACO|nr:hypothetical protein [Apilactobacillus xinyiensis]MCK8624919.1 hypothetical protein [Apilactobacillus xinyiensis]MCL0330246.1 hypothetical protein [Apilactobacillus xinyiensis]